ncbi:secreted protein [marine sediment metagenome]|uniref:Secreted protein n=1 Tax=marine sediment metagenome TaxID=412755 RepID=A0A1B6NS08_9ZZZZ
MARARRLSIIAMSVSPNCLAIARARTTPPTSGETTMILS